MQRVTEKSAALLNLLLAERLAGGRVINLYSFRVYKGVESPKMPIFNFVARFEDADSTDFQEANEPISAIVKLLAAQPPKVK